ncbi:MAG TPA: CHRD domain-containing protein [Burkholderiales bacterium]
MKKLVILAALCAAFPAYADRNGDGDRLFARLTGYEEVPSVSTPASGEFKATISRDEGMIEYELSYSGLQNTTPGVSQAHIHFAQRGVNGSIVLWLCQTPGTPAPAAVAALTPQCPQSGTVSGTLTAANVIAATTTSQLILAGELAEVIAAIRAGRAYVNVHALPLNGGGEIRGQIRDNRGRGHDDRGHGPHH